ncbi:MAG: hypothetical protein ABIH03_16095 [Pseudomonadota bacterium]
MTTDTLCTEWTAFNSGYPVLVKHAASGLSITYMPTEEMAQRLIAAIANLTDWTQSAAALRSTPGLRARIDLIEADILAGAEVGESCG